VCVSGGIPPLILNLGTILKWAVGFTSQTLYPREKSPPRYPLNSRLGGPQGRSGRIEEGKMCFPCRESNQDSSVVETAAQWLSQHN
jgi:hypothetical protein